eukprot:353700-Chlamydomonas_euryale.AAC.7
MHGTSSPCLKLTSRTMRVHQVATSCKLGSMGGPLADQLPHRISMTTTLHSILGQLNPEPGNRRLAVVIRTAGPVRHISQ